MLTFETFVTIAATISEPPDVPLWIYVVPIPRPQRMPPSTTLMAVSARSGGWEMKYPSSRPTNTEATVAP